MASCLQIPGLYGPYPIGNTAPVSLTRDLPPDGPANILLLPCGDPRNILYTVFCEKTNPLRKKLDFTCCDYEPGVLARNVLLLTMILDRVAESTMWNIFFHMYLDLDSRSALISQSKKLATYDSMESWRSSPYGAIIKIGTDHTLSELRRHWELYADFYHPSRLQRLRELQAVMEKRLKHAAANAPKDYLNPIVAAGPLFEQSRRSGLFTEHHRRYWETGTTFTDKQSVADSIHPNSTFFYSRVGEGLDVSPNTDPMVPFHHAPLFGNANHTLTVADLVESAKSQFRAWTSAFGSATILEEDGGLRAVVRFVLGDVLAVAQCLRDFGENAGVRTQSFATPRVPPWTMRTLELNREEYADYGAPTRFDVIDTSNIADYLGLLNIFLVAAPLLMASSSSVLYTASVMIFAPNLRTEVEVRMLASLSAVAILMNLAPADALSGFTSSCNTHEDMTNFVFSNDKDGHHHSFTWKRPSSGDPSVCPDSGHRTPMYFNTPQLIKLLHNIYVDMFKHEDPSHPHWQALVEKTKPDDLKRELPRYSYLCSSREAFAMFLDFIRTSLSISKQQWRAVMSSFQELAHDVEGHVDLQAQLLRYSLYTVTGDTLEEVCRPMGGRLSHWKSLPLLTRIFLLVPRTEFTRVESIVTAGAIRLPAVWLRCYIKLPQGRHVFHSVDAAYGTVVDAGTPAHPDVSICEDPNGWNNGADLVFSFVVLTIVLGLLKETPPGDVFVELGLRNDPLVAVVPPIASSRSVFRACLEDTKHVHLMPEQPLCPRTPAPKTTVTVQPQELADTLVAIGRQQPVGVDIDDAGVHVTSLAAKLEVGTRVG